MKAVNLYCPEQIVAKMNETESVHATFLDHRKNHRPSFCGWEDLLSKCFKRMPPSYTNNYFFEIDNCVVTMRHLITAAQQDAEIFSLIGDGDPITIRKAFLADLFGSNISIDAASMDDARVQFAVSFVAS
ncbi:hypothetical protein GQ600_11469 [Phytophthora cactorum]|nr:hypothetical protein GQ600_11469 [Phytophthora cactorum]